MVQGQQVPNYSFTNAAMDTCAYDTSGSALVYTVPEWESYQTLDSTWTGPHDSACFSLVPTAPNGVYLPLPAISDTLPFYVRSLLDSSNAVALDSNTLYKVFVSQYALSGPVQFLPGNNCKEDLCNGMMLGIQIPDSAGTGTAMRWYKGYGTDNGYAYEFCFPTEKFPNGNHIREAILKYFESPGLNTVDERLMAVSLEDMGWQTNKFTHLDANYQNGPNWAYLMSPFMWPGPNYMAIYHDTTYPGPNAISFIDVDPPPSPTQDTVEVLVDPFSFFIQQPYTALRGGLVQGDTTRHILHLINQGGTICMYQIVELLFENGNGFTYRSGNVNFEGATACMLFGKGGKLRVERNAVFHYGAPNRGMLALRPGGKVEIASGSELIVHNTVSLREYRGDAGGLNFHIYLSRGSKLSFAPGSKITEMGTAFPGQNRLFIHMKGGQLDDSGLDALSLSFLTRVYDTPADELSDNLRVNGNPFDSRLSLSLVSGSDMQVRVRIADVKGSVIWEGEWKAQQGISWFEVPTATWQPGMYLLSCETALGTVSRRVVKQ